MDSKSHLGRIFARNCTVRRIGKALAEDFLSRCHTLGYCSMRYRYGMFLERRQKGISYPEGTLMAVAGFSSPRNLQTPEGTVRSYEWVRYASLPDVRITGGMGKMLSCFIEDVHPGDVMTYAPLPFSGDAYRALGFKEEGLKTFPDGSVSRKFRLTINRD